MLATIMTVEFSTSPMAATNAATSSKNTQSKVRAASARTSCSTWARFVRARTEDEKRDHAVFDSPLEQRIFYVLQLIKHFFKY